MAGEEVVMEVLVVLLEELVMVMVPAVRPQEVQQLNLELLMDLATEVVVEHNKEHTVLVEVVVPEVQDHLTPTFLMLVLLEQGVLVNCGT